MSPTHSGTESNVSRMIDSKCFLAGHAMAEAMVKKFNVPNSERTFRTAIPLCPPSCPLTSSHGEIGFFLNGFAIFEVVLCKFGSEFSC